MNELQLYGYITIYHNAQNWFYVLCKSIYVWVMQLHVKFAVIMLIYFNDDVHESTNPASLLMNLRD